MNDFAEFCVGLWNLFVQSFLDNFRDNCKDNS